HFKRRSSQLDLMKQNVKSLTSIDGVQDHILFSAESTARTQKYASIVGKEITNLKNAIIEIIQDFRNVCYAKDIQIVIGGDWNAHHSAWFDKDIDDVGESVMDFIINNNLQILNSSPFDHTYEKDGKKSSIDITLCSESRWCNNWRTDNDELDLHSDRLPKHLNKDYLERE
ncbi:hypothetical protein RFI_35813, partial [Reticulomyxa filosa]